MRGIYLYAVAAGARRLPLDSIGGVPDGTAACSVIEASGLTAVTSDYGGPPFSDLSRPELLGALLVHQHVLDGVVAEVPVLPVKFGTVLQSHDEARDLLERFHERLQEALKDVGDSVEINLSATWDLQAVLAEIGQSPAVVQAREEISSEADLAARIRLGQLVQETLEGRREWYRRHVVGGLLSLARDAQSNPRTSDDMVINVAFLVPRSELGAFESKVDQYGEELAGQLTFRYVGPLPPYSFATVQVLWPDAAEVGGAREQLGLNERFSVEDVNARFRELAGREHPDRNPDDPSAGERFGALTAARDRLVAYVRGQAGSGTVAVADAGVPLLRVVRADEYLSPELDTRYGPSTFT